MFSLGRLHFLFYYKHNGDESPLRNKFCFLRNMGQTHPTSPMYWLQTILTTSLQANSNITFRWTYSAALPMVNYLGHLFFREFKQQSSTCIPYTANFHFSYKTSNEAILKKIWLQHEESSHHFGPRDRVHESVLYPLFFNCLILPRLSSA